MKKIVLTLTILALAFNLTAFAVSADSHATGIIPAELITAAIEDGSIIILTAETGTIISAQSLFAIRDSGVTAKFLLPSGITVSIDPAKITDSAKTTDLNVFILAIGNTDVLNGWVWEDWGWEDPIAEWPVEIWDEPDIYWPGWQSFDEYWADYGAYYREWYPDVDWNVLNNLKTWEDYYDFWNDYWNTWNERMSDFTYYWSFYGERYKEWYPDADISALNNAKTWDEYYAFWDNYWANWVYVPRAFDEYMADYRAYYPDWYSAEWYPDINWAAFNNLKSWDEYYAFWDSYWASYVSPFIYESFYEIDFINGIRSVWKETRRATGEVIYEGGWWMDYRVLIIPAATGKFGFEIAVEIPESMFSAAGISTQKDFVSVNYLDEDYIYIFGDEALPVNADGSVTFPLTTGLVYMLMEWWDWDSYIYYNDDVKYDYGRAVPMPATDMGGAPTGGNSRDMAVAESGGGSWGSPALMGMGGFTDGFGVMYDANGNMIDRSSLARGGGEIGIVAISADLEENPKTSASSVSTLVAFLMLGAAATFVSRKKKA